MVAAIEFEKLPSQLFWPIRPVVKTPDFSKTHPPACQFQFPFGRRPLCLRSPSTLFYTTSSIYFRHSIIQLLKVYFSSFFAHQASISLQTIHRLIISATLDPFSHILLLIRNSKYCSVSGDNPVRYYQNLFNKDLCLDTPSELWELCSQILFKYIFSFQAKSPWYTRVMPAMVERSILEVIPEEGIIVRVVQVSADGIPSAIIYRVPAYVDLSTLHLKNEDGGPVWYDTHHPDGEGCAGQLISLADLRQLIKKEVQVLRSPSSTPS